MAKANAKGLPKRFSNPARKARRERSIRGMQARKDKRVARDTKMLCISVAELDAYKAMSPEDRAEHVRKAAERSPESFGPRRVERLLPS